MAHLMAGQGASAQPIFLADILAGTDDGFAVNGAAAGDKFGQSVSAGGDVNGDGLDDIFAGAPYGDPLGGTDSGAGYYVFGKTDSAPIDASDIFAGGPQGDIFSGTQAGAKVGRGGAFAGDVNGDGLGDTILGAPQHNPGGAPNTGRSYVVFGDTLGGDFNLSELEAGGSTNGFVINGPASNTYSGRSVSTAGDVNGDGKDDLLVNAPSRTSGSFLNGGRTFVVFGKTDGAAVNLADIESGANTNGFAINGDLTSSLSGNDIASAGDVNGDGFGDVLVSSRYTQAPPFSTQGGRSYVIFGKTTSGAVDLTEVAAGGSGKGFLVHGQNPADGVGSAASSAGDVNADGLDDVIIGARGGDQPGRINCGRSFVIFGRTDSPVINISEFTNLAQAVGFAINGEAANDNSGDTVSSAGDVNGDGLGDVLISAPEFDGAAGTNSGRHYVVLGKTTNTAVELSSLAGTSTNGFVIEGNAPNVGSTTVNSVGDANGDGLSDFAIGVPLADTAAGTDAGRVFVIHSPYGKTLPPLAAETATYRAVAPAGDPPPIGIGTDRHWRQLASFNESHFYIDFNQGTGPSNLEVQIFRHNAGISNTPTTPASVAWLFETDRQPTSGNLGYEVTVEYTDEEILGLVEEELHLFEAELPSGPWTPLASVVVDPARNRIKGTGANMLPTPRHFIIAPAISEPINGDANNDGVVNVADLTAIANVINGIDLLLFGDGDMDNDGDLDKTDIQLVLNVILGP